MMAALWEIELVWLPLKHDVTLRRTDNEEKVPRAVCCAVRKMVERRASCFIWRDSKTPSAKTLNSDHSLTSFCTRFGLA